MTIYSLGLNLWVSFEEFAGISICRTDERTVEGKRDWQCIHESRGAHDHKTDN